MRVKRNSSPIIKFIYVYQLLHNMPEADDSIARLGFMLSKGISNFFRKRELILDEKDIKKICEYLENPTKTGIWTLKASRADTFKKYLEKEIKKSIQDSGSTEVSSGKKVLNINFEKIDEESLLKNLDELPFVFTVFSYLYHFEQEHDSFNIYLDMEDPKYKILLEIINFEKLKNEFNDAFDYFKEYIYSEDFNITKHKKITKIKDGFFFLPKKTDQSEIVELISLTKNPLEKVKVFLEKAGFINEASLLPTYSPEEEVFSPYFSLLEQAYSKIIDNNDINDIRGRFKESISAYNDKNYPYCISTVGLITEEYLVRIYEHLFRDSCPRRLSLGKLYDQIHIKIKEELGSETEKNIDFSKYSDEIFDKIRKIERVDKYPSEDIISILRDLVKLTKEIHSITESKIKDIQKPKHGISIFNKQLKDNIGDVIKYRNATSHRSHILIGDYEAIKSVYGCITLILWWTKQKEAIDYDEKPNEILKKIVNGSR